MEKAVRRIGRAIRSFRYNRNLIPDLVDALYRTLLLRTPDPVGRAQHINALTKGRLSIGDAFNSILGSEEFFHKRGRLLTHHHPERHDQFFMDMSQFGEIPTLVRAMMDMVCTNRIVVDVGVLGVHDSNSYDLMRWFGWRGLLIEANDRLIDRIRHEFGPLNYKIVNVAVSNHEGEATLHIGTNNGVSSLTQAHSAKFGPTAGQISVKVEPLPAILAREDIPLRFDLLSIDIEGEDIKVLNHLITTSPYRPNWIIVEAGLETPYSPGILPLVPAFDAEYECVGATIANLIFRNRSLLQRLKASENR
ncbi:FkbM family methyltransferase [Sphingobium sp. AP50]|uniref:FkbM family methyltransferase n=1 Tax=Sphingobium sp. AP50 TaxID=1884369 RepID=UPI0011602EB3|nr:FkbM family methyltransferase [Sphingobium sp. AP50]